MLNKIKDKEGKDEVDDFDADNDNVTDGENNDEEEKEEDNDDDNGENNDEEEKEEDNDDDDDDFVQVSKKAKYCIESNDEKSQSGDERGGGGRNIFKGVTKGTNAAVAITESNNVTGSKSEVANSTNGVTDVAMVSGGVTKVIRDGCLRRSHRKSKRIINYKKLSGHNGDEDEEEEEEGFVVGDDDDDFKRGMKRLKRSKMAKNNKKNSESRSNKKYESEEEDEDDDGDGDDDDCIKITGVENIKTSKVASIFNQRSKSNRTQETVLSKQEKEALERKRNFLFGSSGLKITNNKKDVPVDKKRVVSECSYMAPLPLHTHTTQLPPSSSSLTSSSLSIPLKAATTQEPLIQPPPHTILPTSIHNLKKQLSITQHSSTLPLSTTSLSASTTSNLLSLSDTTTTSSTASTTSPLSTTAAATVQQLPIRLQPKQVDLLLHEMMTNQRPSFDVPLMYQSLKSRRDHLENSKLKITEPVLWTDKYRPMKWQDFLGNRSTFKGVHDWLNECKNKLPSCANGSHHCIGNATTYNSMQHTITCNFM